MLRRSGFLRAPAGQGGLAIVLALAGCSAWPDPTSVSQGDSNRGAVLRPRRIAAAGPGWELPPTWRERGLHYGTDELVGAIEHAAARVDRMHAPGRLGIADLSRFSGGASRWHRSHHSGRDVDVMFYSVDARGRPISPPTDAMVPYDASGRATLGPDAVAHGPPRFFDTTRNWAFIETLLGDPTIRVQWIFVSDPLRAQLLEYAERQARPLWAREYAALVMRQPGDSAPHDDHFHIRVYCSRSDRRRGCIDRGPVWQHEKKTHKYPGPERFDPVHWRRLGLVK